LSPIKGSLSRDKTTHRQKTFLFLEDLLIKSDYHHDQAPSLLRTCYFYHFLIMAIVVYKLFRSVTHLDLGLSCSILASLKNPRHYAPENLQYRTMSKRFVQIYGSYVQPLVAHSTGGIKNRTQPYGINKVGCGSCQSSLRDFHQPLCWFTAAACSSAKYLFPFKYLLVLHDEITRLG
jgi:hypothetical protein